MGQAHCELCARLPYAIGRCLLVVVLVVVSSAVAEAREGPKKC